jgi:hypothetical protein
MEKTLANAIEMSIDVLVVLSLQLERKQEWFIDFSASKHVIRNKTLRSAIWCDMNRWPI